MGSEQIDEYIRDPIYAKEVFIDLLNCTRKVFENAADAYAHDFYAFVLSAMSSDAKGIRMVGSRDPKMLEVLRVCVPSIEQAGKRRMCVF